MQTSIDDSGIFTEVSRSAQASPQSSLEPLARNPLQRPSSRSGNSVDSFGPSPRTSGSPVKPLMAKPLPDRSPPSSLSSFQPKRRRSCSLRYTVVTTPQTQLVWSRKTTSPAEYNNGVRKHRGVRVMQTSLNTRPNPQSKHKAMVLLG